MTFALVPVEILALDLTPAALRMAIAVLSYADRNTGECWPTIETLAGRAGLPRATAFRGLAELKDRGLVESSGRRKRWVGIAEGPTSETERSHQLDRPTSETVPPVRPQGPTSETQKVPPVRRKGPTSETQNIGPRTDQRTDQAKKTKSNKPRESEVNEVFAAFANAQDGEERPRNLAGWQRKRWARDMLDLIESGVTVEQLKRAARAQGEANRERPGQYRAKVPRSVLEGGLALIAGDGTTPAADLHGNPILSPGDWNEFDDANRARGCIWMGEERPHQPWGAPPPGWRPNQ